MTERNDRGDAPRTHIAIVIPAYNESDGLRGFHARLAAVMEALGSWEALYVNDGSRDDTWEVMQSLRAADPHVSLLNLSRNFGKEIAIAAGLDHADADAVVVIDADLQDPPELIPELVARWQEGFDTVYAQRRVRQGETWLKRTTAAGFYRLMQRVGRVKIPENVGDFRLMSRRVVLALRRLPEQHRFMKGLFAWVGFPAVAVPYDRDPRASGESKFNYWRLWNLALEGITGFTVVPLKVATYVGLAVAVLAGLYGAELIFRTLIFGNRVAGYPSLMTVVLFLGGVQMLMLGIIGEYLGRVLNETKRRPLYFVERYQPSAAAPREPAAGDAAD